MGWLRNMGGMEWIVIGAIALLIFGPKQIPKLGRMFGDTVKGIRQARKELQQEADAVNDALRDDGRS